MIDLRWWKLSTINITKARQNLFQLVSDVNVGVNLITIVNNKAKNTVLISEEEWERTYMGDEATFTFFIDLVNETFAGNSLTAETFPIKDWDAIHMFQTIQKK